MVTNRGAPRIFSRGGGGVRAHFYMYIGQKGAKNQASVSYLPRWGLSRSSNIAKRNRTHSAKLKLTLFNVRNPQNLVFFNVLKGAAPQAPLGAPWSQICVGPLLSFFFFSFKKMSKV